MVCHAAQENQRIMVNIYKYYFGAKVHAENSRGQHESQGLLFNSGVTFLVLV